MSVKQKPGRQSAPAPKKPAKAAPKTKAGVAQQAERRPSKSEVSGSSPDARSKRVAIDWEAIEASHRTGRYSDSQLAKLHNVSREAICRKRKKDQAEDPNRWQKDLREQVRQATSALLAADAVAKEADKDHSKITVTVTDVISANAAKAKDVIVGHRKDIAAVRDLAADLLAEIRLATHSADQIAELFEKVTEDTKGAALAIAQQQFRDFMRVHSRVGSVHKLADTLAKLQTLERKAFSLDDPEEKPKGGGAPGGSIYSLSDEELVDDLMQEIMGRKKAAAA